MRKIIFLALSLFSVSVFSANVWHTSAIKTVYPLASGDYVVIFANNSSCAREDGYHYVSVGSNGVTLEGSKNMLSVLLSAAAMQKPV